MVKWIITKYEHVWVDKHLFALIETDQPIHAFLHYSLEKELFSAKASERRGIRRGVEPLWELANPIELEQDQPGDTLKHRFFLPGVPAQATLTFYLTATQDSIETKSVSVPIKIQHPCQDGADPVNPTPFGNWVREQVWEQNIKDAVGIHDDIWNVTGMTGTGYFAYGMNQLSLIIGPTAGSVAEIYAGDIFDLALNPDLKSQLRAVVRFPHVSDNLLAHIVHGDIAVGSGYGFITYNGDLRGFMRNPDGGAYVDLGITLEDDTTYLLEAKFRHFYGVQFWVNGEFILEHLEGTPETTGHSFHARITDPDTASVAIHFRRFMIWQESIWTGEYHSS